MTTHTASLQPLQVLLSPSIPSIHALTVTILPSHIFFSKKAFSPEMFPVWQDNQTGCNCTALPFCRSACFGREAYVLPHNWMTFDQLYKSPRGKHLFKEIHMLQNFRIVHSDQLISSQELLTEKMSYSKL